MKIQTALLTLSLTALPVSAAIACDAPATPAVPTAKVLHLKK